jgi:glycosyltransferase involved in cell wall biosynthesis
LNIMPEMDNRSRILYLHHQGKLGGAERSLLALFSALDRERYDVAVASPERGRFTELVKQSGIRHFAFEFSGLRRIGRLAVNVVRLSRLVRGEAIDLLHSNGPQTNIASGLVGVLTGTRVVWHARNIVFPGMIDWDRWFFSLADHIVCNSRAIRDRFVRSRGYERKTSVILNAVDSEQIAKEELSKEAAREKTGLPRHGFVMGVFDRLDPRKGHATVFRAFEKVRCTYPDSLLLVVGEAFEDHERRRRSLEQLAEDLGLRDAIRFLGFRKDVFILMSACDVVILASGFEGCSRVLCEAQALGRPVVASDAGGNPELVEDAKTGFLFPLGNENELAQCLNRLLADRDLLARFGRSAKDKAERDFSMRRYYGQTVRVYDSVLGPPSSGK